MQFHYDVYISHHSEDDALNGTAGTGWLPGFRKYLESILTQMLGQQARIYQTSDLKKPEPARFRSTAVFILLITPEYLNSNECIRDAELCTEAVRESGAEKINDLSRIITIFQKPVAKGSLPHFLQPYRHYDFFNQDAKTGTVTELAGFFNSEAEKVFWLKLADLAHDIHQICNQVRVQNAGTNILPEIPGSSAVYLADTGLDLVIQRDIIRRELIRHGFKVLPEETLPMNEEELTDKIKRDLRECRLSIHLLGEEYGELIKDSEKSVPDLQNQLASDYDRENTASGADPDAFIRLVWMPSKVQPESEKQQILIEKVRRDADIHSETEIIQTPLEDLKTIILDILIRNKHNSGIRRDWEKDKGGKPRIYLIYNQEDQQEAASVENYLSSTGFHTIKTWFEGSNIELRQIHQDNLSSCDAALVIHSKANPEWLVSKVLDLLKAPGLGRNKPLKARAILALSEKRELNNAAKIFQVPTIDSSGGFDQSKLSKFINQVRL